MVSKTCAHCLSAYIWLDNKQNLCDSCRRIKAKLRQRTMVLVRRAIIDGHLPALDGSVQCVDCGKAARHYDHRNYNKPLAVEPTCRSCNWHRGPALPFRDLVA